MSDFEMPELAKMPEDTFFRIKKAPAREYVKIELRVRASFLGLKFSHVRYEDYAYPNPESVAYMAEKLITLYRNADERANMRRQLLGDYPPKKLGDIK